MLITCRAGESDRVTLTDDSGNNALATIADGAEVVIVAWRPRRGADTRYRVVATDGGVEGWVGAKSLTRRQPPPSPKGAGIAAPPEGTRRGTR